MHEEMIPWRPVVTAMAFAATVVSFYSQDAPRCVVHSQWDGTPRPRNKAALKAAKQHKAATRRAGKR